MARGKASTASLESPFPSVQAAQGTISPLTRRNNSLLSFQSCARHARQAGSSGGEDVAMLLGQDRTCFQKRIIRGCYGDRPPTNSQISIAIPLPLNPAENDAFGALGIIVSTCAPLVSSNCCCKG